MTNSSHDPELSQAIAAVRAQPSDFVAWDLLDAHAERTEAPEPIAELYAEALAADLPTVVARKLCDRSLRFGEAWFGDDAPHMQALLVRVFALEPRDDVVFERLTVSLTAAGRWDLLLEVYERALTVTDSRERRAQLLDDALKVAKDVGVGPERALALLRELTALRPEDDGLHAQLERLLETTGRHRELVLSLSARAERAERPELWLRVAALWLHALKSAPPALEIAERLLRAGDRESDVLALLEELFAADVSAPATRRAVLELLSSAYATRGRPLDEARVLRTGAGLYEGDERTARHLRAARLLREGERPDEALVEYGEAFVHGGADPLVQDELEAHALEAGLAGAYADLLEQAASSQVERGAARPYQLLLRAARLREGTLHQREQAVALYERVLAQSEVCDAALEAGRALDALYDVAGDGAARARVLARLAQLEPVASVRRELAFALAKVAVSLGDPPRALEVLRARLAEDPQDREALDALIAIHEQERDFGPLVESLRRRAGLVGGRAGALDLGRAGQLCAEELNDLDRALALFGELYAAEPALATELSLGRLLGRSGEREVEQEARRASALGDAQREWLGDSEAALAQYARALSIAPALGPARSGLQALLADERVRGRAAELLAGAHATFDDVEGLLELLPYRLAAAASGADRARLLRQAAQLELRRDDPARALEHARAALVEDPEESTGDLDLWRLSEQQDAFPELADALREAADKLDGSPLRRGQLRVSEGELSELRLLDLPRALEAYRAAHRLLPNDAAVAEAVCRVAALCERYLDACEVVVAVADRLDQVPDGLLALLEERASESRSFRALADAARSRLGDARLKPPVRRALLLRIAEWYEQRAGEPASAEEMLRDASTLGGPHAETLRRLVVLQRRKPDRALLETLLASAELNDRDLGLLAEAAELARTVVEDEALERSVLERLVRRSAGLLRDGREASDGRSAEEALVRATRRLADVLAASGESRAELALLREAASYPVAAASARAFAERAAQLAVDVLGDHDLSIALYQRALELAPDDPDLLSALGAQYARKGRLDDLVVLRRRELAATPTVARRLALRLDLARVLGELEARGGRLAALRENLAEAPGHPESLAQAEAILRAQGALVATFELLAEQAAQLEAVGDSGEAAALWMRAAELADVELADDERALVAYQRLAGIEHDERALSSLARLRLKRGEPQLAVPWLERSLEGRAPEERLEVRLRLAHAHEAAGNLEGAAHTLEAGVAEAPDADELRARLAELYERLGRLDALADLLADSATRAREPERLLGHARRAAALYRDELGTPERGVDVLARAVAAQPSDRGLKLDYVDALIAAGKVGEARAVLEAMVLEFGRRRSPERAELHMRLSRVARAEGQVEEALEQLDTAASMDRSHPGILRALGELAMQAGQLERAERAYRTLLIVLRKQPGVGGAEGGAAEVLYELHRIAIELGQREKAAELLESAVQTAINSEGETARLKGLLLERGEPELLLRVLELRLAQMASPATEAEVLSDLADVLEGTLERKEEALEARLKALACAPESDALHAATQRVANALGQARRYVDTLASLVERARRKDEWAEVGDLSLRAGSACEHALADLEGAATFYREVTPAMPSYVEAQFALARVAGKLGRKDEEHEVLARLAALPEEPAYLEGKRSAVYRLIELQVQRKEAREEGLAALSRLLEREPDYARASQILQAAYESDPTDLGTLMLLEQTARRSGDPGVLLEALERRARLDDVPLALVREAAELAARLADGERAEQLARRGLEISEARGDDDQAAWAPALLARTLARRGDTDGALAWFERALSVDPEGSFELGLELAAVASGGEAEQRDRAMRVYDRLRAHSPADRRVWAPLIAFHAEQGDHDRLLEVVRETLEALDTSAARNALRLDSARLLLEAGREEDGAGLLEAVLAEDPDHSEAALRLADLYERRGQLDELVELLHRKLERAREQRSPSVIPLSLRMGAMLAQSRPEQAADLYRRALELMPESDALLRAAIEQCDAQEQAEERAELIVRYLSADDAKDREGAAAYAGWLVDYRAEQLEPVAFEQALELAVRAQPDSLDARRRLKAWHGERGNQARVAELLEAEAALEAKPEQAVARLVEAADLWSGALGRSAQAANLLRKARALAPSDLALLRRAVDASAEAGELLPALSDIDAALLALKKDAAERAELLALRAALAGQAGLYDQALLALEEAHALGGSEALAPLLEGLERALTAASERGDRDRERELTLRLTGLLREQGELERALSVLEAFNQRVRGDSEALRLQLSLASEAGRFADALAIAGQLCQQDAPDRLLEPAERLLEAARALGQPQRARSALELAHERAPSDRRLLEHLEQLYREIREPGALARLLAARIDPAADEAVRFEQLRQVGQLLVEAGAAEEALTYLADALALRPDDLTTVLAVADARIGAGQLEAARELVERSMGALKARRSPELSQLRHRMAKLVAAQGDEQGRYDFLNSALEADMNNGDVASELAVVAQELGQLDTALKALRAITMMKGEAAMSRAEAFYRQAVIVAQKGEPRRAVLWAKKAKAEDQHFPGVDRLIAELESA